MTATASAQLAGRRDEVARIADAAREGEPTMVAAAQPNLAAALADAAARNITAAPDWVAVTADARLAADETDLARRILRSLTAHTLGTSDITAMSDPSENVQDTRARLQARRLLGEAAFALLTGTEASAHGQQALSTAVEGVVAVRESQPASLLLVLHGVDELAATAKTRFQDGPASLWAIRGVWQLAHGAAIFTGGPALAAAAADETQGFYGYGLLHEVNDLPPARLDAATRDLFGTFLDDDAVRAAGQLLGQALWLAPDLLARLPHDTYSSPAAVNNAWQQLLDARAPQHFETLRLLGHAHRLAVPVLTAIAREQGPYAALLRAGRNRSEIQRALTVLENNGVAYRADRPPALPPALTGTIPRRFPQPNAGGRPHWTPVAPTAICLELVQEPHSASSHPQMRRAVRTLLKEAYWARAARSLFPWPARALGAFWRDEVPSTDTFRCPPAWRGGPGSRMERHGCRGSRSWWRAASMTGH